MKTGVITYWNEIRKYGFIKDNEGDSYFFHINDVIDKDKINHYKRVKFTEKLTEKGLKAADIEVLNDIKHFITIQDTAIKISMIKTIERHITKKQKQQWIN